MQHLKTSSLALLLLECFNKNNGTKQRGNSRKYILQIHTGLGDCPYYNIMGKNPKGKLNCDHYKYDRHIKILSAF